MDTYTSRVPRLVAGAHPAPALLCLLCILASPDALWCLRGVHRGAVLVPLERLPPFDIDALTAALRPRPVAVHLDMFGVWCLAVGAPGGELPSLDLPRYIPARDAEGALWGWYDGWEPSTDEWAAPDGKTRACQ